MKRSFVLSIVALLLTGCALRPTPAPHPALSRDGRWVQDIDYLVTNLKRLHKDPFRYASEAEFDAAHAELLQQVAQVADADLMVGMARLITRLGDAHTRLVYESDKLLQAAPLDVWRFADGYFLSHTLPHQTDLLGSRIVAVGDIPVADVVARLGTIIPHENDYLLESRAARYFRFPEILAAIGVTETPNAVTLVLEDRGKRRRTVRFTAAAPADELTPIWEVHQRPKMLSEEHTGGLYSYARVPGHDALYIAYNKCREDPDRPMRTFADEIFELLADERIERVILDLRRNGGGNQLVAWPLLKGLARRPINAEGRLFCLIGLNTFSSALNNALEFRRWTDGTLIGEPTGQKPNHFGEVRTFRLPNCGLTVVYSTNYFTQLADDPLTLEPDIATPMTMADWFAGHDPALQTALTLESEKVEE